MPRANFHRLEFRDSFLEHLEDCGAHSFGLAAYPGIEGETAGSAADDLKGADVSAGNDPEVEYLDDIFVGYRWHDTMRIPAFPVRPRAQLYDIRPDRCPSVGARDD